ncbi:TIGR03885 family FMN-dependent LLM class oxidoreductase [Wenxinia marina]|uniref:Putative flavinoid oxidoreductase n=1 Tax=Wenxinia marina DSM 24838 TaxID=1123501 RepID=A0A0D0NIG2_9RHOB|nr:TIGR03885 family FMN-dependent LLM class oxidoreductase [Wenxinia marina]KIQ68120.1 putative flavinoid oxidoreductase [Wenxinia marina DSM 24838]GGL78453.1 LLM class F420-dependent oxidoreductase [Wenxinia marina]
MPSFGYHASHEQFAPDELLALAISAEAAGFQAVMSSDHFHPWSPGQGQSGFAWSWLGAAMQATSVPFGSLAIPGGWRYHPAIVAQAGATLDRMFPGRFRWMAVGSGQALNEHITGGRWPPKAARNDRVEAAVEIIRALWAGETVSRDGPIPTEEARLYTRPASSPGLVGAALSPATAERVGGWADGMITVNQPPDRLRTMIERFRAGGGEGKPLFLQVHLSFAETDEEARAAALAQWRANIVPANVAETLRMPEDFEAATRTVRSEDLEGHVLVSADLQRHRDWLAEFAELGFEEIYLHNVGLNQRAFLDAFGAHVLPKLATADEEGPDDTS